MAKIIRDPIFVDDIDGTTSEDNPTVRTRVIRMEEGTLTIDLSQDNYGKLTEALSPYMSAGEWTERETGTDDENAMIRKWARENGKDVSSRGRIPQDIMDSYREWQKSQHKATQPADDATSEHSDTEHSDADNGSVEPATSDA